MRRGHLGIGGWRNENTRHFRPRGGGNPHYRPRDYPLLDPRFPPPIPRMHRPPFAPRPSHVIDQYAEQNRNKFRYENRRNHNNRPCEKQSHRQIFPVLQRFKHSEINTQNKIYKGTTYHDTTNQRDRYHINNHGDVDHRQSNIRINHLSYEQQSVSPLIHHTEHKEPKYDIKNQNKTYQHYEDVNNLTIHDYPGHRPPSSDHYGNKPTTSIDNSNTFSRSVDDTVNIVRKRLLDRNESLHISDNLNLDNQNNNAQEENLISSYDTQQEQPTKRRIHKQKLPNRSNCDKIKNNIVHQLFKMDKEKIHKLMDNPNSSSKFEYAISSLITESQNSFNRHLRSVAEKSLCSSSTDFIQNDNNTIYEDTFLKQMQCLLDPQDTVFLEDIKPIVMAELSKVLQLDDFEQQCLENEKKIDTHVNEEHLGSDQYNSLTLNKYDISQENVLADKQLIAEDSETPNIRKIANETCKDYDKNQTEDGIIPKSLFERRPRTKSCTYNERRNSITETVRYSRHSLDQKLNENVYKNINETSTLFEPFFEHFSEEEDPFAELDNQYHVAVDHNLIAMEDTSSPVQLQKDDIVKSPLTDTSHSNAENTGVTNIKQEIDNQILCIAKSPLTLSLGFANPNVTSNIEEEENKNTKIVQNMLNVNLEAKYTSKAEEAPIHSDNNTSRDCIESPISCDVPKSLTSSNPRKRPIEQQSSHRKEKRKKIETTSRVSNKQEIKNEKANVNEQSSKTPEKNEPVKFVLNLLSKNNTDCKPKGTSKETKKTDIVEKEYSNKYVKRKNILKDSKDKLNSPKKSHNSVTSSHSSTNIKNDTVTVTNTSAKTDPKNVLTTIDMFTEKPKKVNIHQAHRNTAVVPSTSNTNIIIEKDNVKKKPFSHIKTKRHIATQVIRRQLMKETQTIDTKNYCTRFCQTEKEKTCVKAVQTDPVHFERSHTHSTDTFERMKEIDLEIQVLLQEKFKLYSSLENKESNKNSLQTLGMTVLNVTPFDENVKDNDAEVDTTSGDKIVDDFTNIPVEELEQIAFESVSTDNNENFGIEKRGRRQTILEEERKKSVSPKYTKKLNKRSKAPNISLIEQIITDDRPLEDILALDDFEKPLRTRSKSQKVSHGRRKLTKQIEQINFDEMNIIEIKECSVVLVREDLNKLLAQNSAQLCGFQEHQCEPIDYTTIVEEVEVVEKENSDLQFDMLDVSEDIVIGNSCEIKSLQDKELEMVEVPINDEIILDNSQSSEDIQPPQTLTGDSECKMYDYTADDSLRHDTITVTGNADAVLAIECIENNFIAACLDGNVYYFNGDGRLIKTLRGSNLAVTCLTIVKEKYETTVYTGSLDSRIRYYDLKTGIEKGPECNVLSPIQTMDRAWDTVFVGTRTGFVLQFECKNNMLIPISTVKFSDQSILALRAMKEGPRKVLLVAARSENVTIKDAQTGLLLRTLAGPKMTVYTLLYENGKVFCGTSSHQIQVFDYTSGTHVGAHEGGKGAVCLRASGGVLFAGCYDGCIYVYREGEPQPMAQLRGPDQMLLSLAIVGSKIIAGYKDQSLYIWKIPLSILREMIL